MKRYNLGSQLGYDHEGNMISQGVLHEHPFGRLIYFDEMLKWHQEEMEKLEEQQMYERWEQAEIRDMDEEVK